MWHSHARATTRALIFPVSNRSNLLFDTMTPGATHSSARIEIADERQMSSRGLDSQIAATKQFARNSEREEGAPETYTRSTATTDDDDESPAYSVGR